MREIKKLETDNMTLQIAAKYFGNFNFKFKISE